MRMRNVSEATLQSWSQRNATHREKQVLRVRLQSAESARGKELFHSLGSSWTGLLPAFREQSLQRGELAARSLQPPARASSGVQAPRRGGRRRAETAAFRGRCSPIRALAPQPRLPTDDRGDSGGRRCPVPRQLPLHCRQRALPFSVRPELRFPCSLRPLRPAWQGPRPQKLPVAAPGVRSREHAPGICWPSLLPRGDQVCPGPWVDSHLCMSAPPLSKGMSETGAQR